MIRSTNDGSKDDQNIFEKRYKPKNVSTPQPARNRMKIKRKQQFVQLRSLMKFRGISVLDDVRDIFVEI